MISGAQVRAARAFLGWTARALAVKSGVPGHTIEWIEGEGKITAKDVAALAAVQATFEDVGIEFTDSEGVPGVRLRSGGDGRSKSAATSNTRPETNLL